MTITNTPKPAAGTQTDTARVVDYETWDTNPNTWDGETRTWDETGTELTNTPRPGAYASTPVTVTGTTLTTNSTSWGSYTIRNVINTSALSNTGNIYTRVRFTADTSEALTINAAAIQNAGAGDAYDFSATPVTLTFNGGSTSVVIPAGTSLYSDLVTFTITSSTNIVVAFAIATNTLKAKAAPATVNTVYYKGGSDATTVNASGYTNYSGTLGWLIVDAVESASLIYMTNTPKPI